MITSITILWIYILCTQINIVRYGFWDAQASTSSSNLQGSSGSNQQQQWYSACTRPGTWLAAAGEELMVGGRRGCAWWRGGDGRWRAVRRGGALRWYGLHGVVEAGEGQGVAEARGGGVVEEDCQR